MQWHHIAARCGGMGGSDDRFAWHQLDGWQAQTGKCVADHPQASRFTVIAVDAYLEAIAAFDQAQSIYAAQAHTAQADGFIQQLQPMLLALLPRFLYRPLTG